MPHKTVLNQTATLDIFELLRLKSQQTRKFKSYSTSLTLQSTCTSGLLIKGTRVTELISCVGSPRVET